jgi:hypothetical protein
VPTRILLLCLLLTGAIAPAQTRYTLENEWVRLTVDGKASLLELTNKKTGRNYAGGKPLWRLYFDRGPAKDNEVLAATATPSIKADRKKDLLTISYAGLAEGRNPLPCRLSLEIRLVKDDIKFAASLSHTDPALIIRELQYPLIGALNLAPDQVYINSTLGGQRFENPKQVVRNYQKANYPPYYTPEQHFYQMDLTYPDRVGLSMNFFAYANAQEGLYVGSHDPTFQSTGQGMRLYDGYENLEAGLYKYPHLLAGKTWQNDSYVVSPYSGTWHVAARKYRAWADSWFAHTPAPPWVQRMKGWQRIIMRHQYGETFFTYDDLPRVYRDGQSVHLNTVLLHGWTRDGHDNYYPEYIPDEAQGGEKAFKQAVADFQANGGHVLLYYNGRLIDKATEYYKNAGRGLTIKDSHGAEYQEAYRFRGAGSFTGSYANRTFAIADPAHPDWTKRIIGMADQALAYGCHSVFYDQMGAGDYPTWRTEGGYAIPQMTTAVDKARLLKAVKDHIRAKDPNMALGTELLSDCVAQHADYIHAQYGAAGVTNDWEKTGTKPKSNHFIDLFRYTFPEVILSDREIRDDTDIERRVNHTVLKGLRNDVEIYRCRATISAAPHYQGYLAQVNALKDKYLDLLVAGTYRDTDGIEWDNPEIDARCFVTGNRLAVVLAQSHLASASTRLQVPGYRFVESAGVGTYAVEPGGGQPAVQLGKHGLAVAVFERTH